MRQWKACGDVLTPTASEFGMSMASLADYVQASLMLNYNGRKVG